MYVPIINLTKKKFKKKKIYSYLYDINNNVPTVKFR